ncbi:Hypothetical predicted protein [Marmota monax]|uniref:Uncharacterized protein n=1 Tax=Marmota monax TaxID=9995 RepID=A0A5E4A1U3_MARMO|nr:Hypothetical predicted protein [Marmota monax]
MGEQLSPLLPPPPPAPLPRQPLSQFPLQNQQAQNWVESGRVTGCPRASMLGKSPMGLGAKGRPWGLGSPEENQNMADRQVSQEEESQMLLSTARAGHCHLEPPMGTWR